MPPKRRGTSRPRPTVATRVRGAAKRTTRPQVKQGPIVKISEPVPAQAVLDAMMLPNADKVKLGQAVQEAHHANVSNEGLLPWLQAKFRLHKKVIVGALMALGLATVVVLSSGSAAVPPVTTLPSGNPLMGPPSPDPVATSLNPHGSGSGDGASLHVSAPDGATAELERESSAERIGKLLTIAGTAVTGQVLNGTLPTTDAPANEPPDTTRKVDTTDGIIIQIKSPTPIITIGGGKREDYRGLGGFALSSIYTQTPPVQLNVVAEPQGFSRVPTLISLRPSVSGHDISIPSNVTLVAVHPASQIFNASAPASVETMVRHVAQGGQIVTNTTEEMLLSSLEAANSVLSSPYKKQLFAAIAVYVCLSQNGVPPATQFPKVAQLALTTPRAQVDATTRFVSSLPNTTMVPFSQYGWGADALQYCSGVLSDNAARGVLAQLPDRGNGLVGLPPTPLAPSPVLEAVDACLKTPAVPSPSSGKEIHSVSSFLQKVNVVFPVVMVPVSEVDVTHLANRIQPEEYSRMCLTAIIQPDRELTRQEAVALMAHMWACAASNHDGAPTGVSHGEVESLVKSAAKLVGTSLTTEQHTVCRAELHWLQQLRGDPARATPLLTSAQSVARSLQISGDRALLACDLLLVGHSASMQLSPLFAGMQALSIQSTLGHHWAQTGFTEPRSGTTDLVHSVFFSKPFMRASTPQLYSIPVGAPNQISTRQVPFPKTTPLPEPSRESVGVLLNIMSEGVLPGLSVSGLDAEKVLGDVVTYLGSPGAKQNLDQPTVANLHKALMFLPTHFPRNRAVDNAVIAASDMLLASQQLPIDFKVVADRLHELAAEVRATAVASKTGEPLMRVEPSIPALQYISQHLTTETLRELEPAVHTFPNIQDVIRWSSAADAFQKANAASDNPWVNAALFNMRTAAFNVVKSGVLGFGVELPQPPLNQPGNQGTALNLFNVLTSVPDDTDAGIQRARAQERYVLRWMACLTLRDCNLPGCSSPLFLYDDSLTVPEPGQPRSIIQVMFYNMSAIIKKTLLGTKEGVSFEKALITPQLPCPFFPWSLDLTLWKMKYRKMPLATHKDVENKFLMAWQFSQDSDGSILVGTREGDAVRREVYDAYHEGVRQYLEGNFSALPGPQAVPNLPFEAVGRSYWASQDAETMSTQPGLFLISKIQHNPMLDSRQKALEMSRDANYMGAARVNPDYQLGGERYFLVKAARCHYVASEMILRMNHTVTHNILTPMLFSDIAYWPDSEFVPEGGDALLQLYRLQTIFRDRNPDMDAVLFFPITDIEWTFRATGYTLKNLVFSDESQGSGFAAAIDQLNNSPYKGKFDSAEPWFEWLATDAKYTNNPKEMYKGLYKQLLKERYAGSPDFFKARMFLPDDTRIWVRNVMLTLNSVRDEAEKWAMDHALTVAADISSPNLHTIDYESLPLVPFPRQCTSKVQRIVAELWWTLMRKPPTVPNTTIPIMYSVSSTNVTATADKGVNLLHELAQSIANRVQRDPTIAHLPWTTFYADGSASRPTT